MPILDLFTEETVAGNVISVGKSPPSSTTEVVFVFFSCAVTHPYCAHETWENQKNLEPKSYQIYVNFNKKTWGKKGRLHGCRRGCPAQNL